MKKKVNKNTKAYAKKLERRAVNKAFKDWSLAVRTRDNMKCVICGTDKYVHAHHLLPREMKEFRFDLDNGISLCARHHKYDTTISAHKNPFVFAFWLQWYKTKQFLILSDRVSKMLKDKVWEGSPL